MKRKRLTKEQRDDLLNTYLSGGFEAAKPVAESCGVNPLYASFLARRRGYIGNRVKCRAGFSDPRWERAKAIGPILA